MITYNSENALIFNVPFQYGCTLPSLKDVQSYSFGGYGTGISAFGVQQGAQGAQSPGIFIKTAPDTWGILLGDEFQPKIRISRHSNRVITVWTVKKTRYWHYRNEKNLEKFL